MKAIILAAGKGTRLKKYHNLPKGLLKFGKNKISILERLCAILKKNKFKKIVIITGYKNKLIERKIGKVAQYIYYPGFRNNNNLQTLLAAKKELNEGFYCFFADLIFDEKIIKKLIEKKANACLTIDTKKILSGTMRIKKKQDRIIGVGSHIPTKDGDGNFIGIAKCSKPGALLLKSHLIREKNNKKDYYTHVINKIIEEKKIVNFFDCKRYFWKEIDTYKDLCDMKAVINKKKFKYWPL